MHQLGLSAIMALALVACGGAKPPESSTAGEEAMLESADLTSGESTPSEQPLPDDGSGSEFALQDSESPAQDQTESKIKPTATEAALKFTVVDKDKGPVPGIVVVLTAPDGRKYYTDETSAQGYAEVLVPNGQRYKAVFLSLGRREIDAWVPVSNQPKQTIRLRLNYKFHPPEKVEPPFVLEGVYFETGEATIRPESYPELDEVAEFMTRKPSARIEISGHTDSAGNRRANKVLSTKRAQACRDYLISKGIEASRIDSVGYGDERPIASNDTDEGRQRNRRIEAREL
jgi:outer membrane protein OmpA-like peptidoglycan-associated protein